MQSQDPLANRDPLANQDPVEGLVVSNISKHFGGVKALQNVRLEASFGTIHGLVGENGAGKSTIVKILSGRLAADSGSIAVRGRTLAVAPQRVDPGNVISTAYQELSVVPQWDVASNLLYCREPVVRFGRIGRRALRSQARDVLNALDVTWIDPTELVRNLSLADRQVLEIVRAIDTNAPVLLLDEPTSALPPERVAWFYDCIRRFLAPNNLVLFISHRLEEVRALCNWVTVLRNGSDVGTGPATSFDDARLVQLMLGEHDRSAYQKRSVAPALSSAPAREMLSVEGLSVPPHLKSVTLRVHAGEIVGIAALEGQGQLDLFQALYGLRKYRGTVKIEGRRASLRSAAAALRAGIGFVPEDRSIGLCVPLSILDNIVLGNYSGLSTAGVLRRRSVADAVRRAIHTLSIRCSGPKQIVNTLSGGNQQKVLLARVVSRDPSLLLLYDANRGVDVGTREEVLTLVQQRASAGAGVLYYSTDLGELLQVAHRVLVLHDGRITAEVERSVATRAHILMAVIGGSSG